jgi:hypothetical protein
MTSERLNSSVSDGLTLCWCFPYSFVGLDNKLYKMHGTFWGAVKSLARPGRKQTAATEDFEFHISYLLS